MPLVHREKINPDTELGIWEITETETDLRQFFLFQEQDEAFFNLLRAGKRRLHWLSSRILLRMLLDSKFPAAIEVDAHGKPSLRDYEHHFSLSHSADHAAVIVSKRARVGIDIEEIQHKIERITDKFLSQQEAGFIAPANRIGQLYACWSAKEAVYKLQGKKSVSFRDHIHIHAFDFQPQGQMQVLLNGPDEHLDLTVHYRRFKSCMLAWVLDTVCELSFS